MNLLELPNLRAISGRVALGLSGGPDSMALAWLLSKLNIPTEAVIVNHDLRADAADEARQVAAWLSDWANIRAHIVIRPAPAVATRVMERARDDRYRLLVGFCDQWGIPTLLTAHHRDDQAETLLFRLAKGSGIDGLAGMDATTTLSDRLTLLRPLLDVPKADLVDLCRTNAIPYIDDPSNTNSRYARTRLRQALEREGATARRLAQTAKRIARAKRALDYFAEEARRRSIIVDNADCIELKRSILAEYPDDIRVRVMAISMKQIGRLDDDAKPSGWISLEKVESLTELLFAAETSRRDTLHRCLVEYRRKPDVIRIARERET